MKKTKIKFNGNETRKLMEAIFTLEKKQNLLITITKYQFVDEVDKLLHKFAKKYYITYILLHFCNICNLFRNK